MSKVKMRVWAKLPCEEKERSDIIEVDVSAAGIYAKHPEIAKQAIMRREFQKWLYLQTEGCGHMEVVESLEVTMDLTNALSAKMPFQEES